MRAPGSREGDRPSTVPRIKALVGSKYMPVEPNYVFVIDDEHPN